MKSDARIELRFLEEKDIELVTEIYNYYILHSTATFHTTPLSMDKVRALIPFDHPKYKSFLISYNGQACGYCYIGQYKPRAAYDRTAEVSLYLKPEYTRKGIGSYCLEQLEHIAGAMGIHVLIGVITDENSGSKKVFLNAGYEQGAHFRQVGEKFGSILDVAAFQKILDNTAH